MQKKFEGLIAAAITPMSLLGDLQTAVIEVIFDRLLEDGVRGLYVCGSTGEGVSLSTRERMEVAEAYVRVSDGRMPVFVQVGHNSLKEAAELAVHASSIGADAISATCPHYFKIESEENLVDSMQCIAQAAADTPFYYYHIPSLTGSQLCMPTFLELALERIPNLAGLKFTSPELHLYRACCQIATEKLQIFWGTDEMLLPALTVGADAAIGSTYNIAAPLYNQIRAAYREKDLQRAAELQDHANRMIVALSRFPFQSALKFVLALRCNLQPTDVCASRLPLRSISSDEQIQLRELLNQIGFFDW